MSGNGPITKVLDGIGTGRKEAVAELFELVYQELRRHARFLMSRERSSHTLQPTALVNEAFLKMAGGAEITWENRRHFYNAAADAMRKILVDHARRKNADKRGGALQIVHLDGTTKSVSEDGQSADFDLLDIALAKLRELDERRYHVVMYRYFAGLAESEIAQLLKVAVKTVQRDWQTAKVFLLAEIKNGVREKESHGLSTAGRVGRSKRREIA